MSGTLNKVMLIGHTGDDVKMHYFEGGGCIGRFPLATKMFMQYCMNIHSRFKIGEEKSDTKLLTKIAYKGRFPLIIINKMKTGWTVPLQHWWKKPGKADIPAMIVKDWLTTYTMKPY